MKLSEKNAEILIGCLLFVFSLALLYLIIPSQIALIEGVSPGPRSLPEFYGYALALLSALLIGHGYLKASPEKILLSVSARELGLVAFTVLAMAACTLALEVVPYVPTTAVTLIVMMWAFGYRDKISILLISIGFPVVVYLFFKYILRLVLP